MTQFRKKPVVIEAMQLRWETWNEMCEFVGVGLIAEGKPEGCYIDVDGFPCAGSDVIGLSIPILEGVMLARQDDWIIRGVKGELYPCKPDIFDATYEVVDA